MKSVLLTSLAFIISTVIYGQSSFGVKGGLNIAKIKDLTASPIERYAFYAGMVYRRPISKKFFIQPELQYSSKGQGFEPPFASRKGAYRFQYLALPLLFGFNADEKLSILVGPEFGYLLKCAVRFEESITDETNQYPRFDAGIDIGLSYKINKKLGAELRYNYGFNTLYYTDFVGVQHDEIKGGNRVFQAGIYYWFN